MLLDTTAEIAEMTGMALCSGLGAVTAQILQRKGPLQVEDGDSRGEDLPVHPLALHASYVPGEVTVSAIACLSGTFPKREFTSQDFQKVRRFSRKSEPTCVGGWNGGLPLPQAA